MIFVSVGMHYLGFDRLVKKIDAIAESSNEEIIIQLGRSKYRPKYAKYFEFDEYDSLLSLISASRLIICQGAMTAMDSILLGKPVLVVPRSSENGEVIDNHQMVFAKKLAELGYCTLVKDLDKLEVFINQQCILSNHAVINHLFLSRLKQYVNEI
jgi:beta-1,4-N-acetylglucosaminyltransferase